MTPTTALSKKKKYNHQQQQQHQVQRQEQQQQQQQMELEQEIAAATAALLGDESTYRLLDESPTSGSVGSVYPTQMTFMIGEKKDKRVVVTELGVTIVTKSDPHKQMKFTQNRWARFLAIVSQVDEEAKELNRKTREVCYHRHICDAFFVSVTDGFAYTKIRKSNSCRMACQCRDWRDQQKLEYH